MENRLVVTIGEGGRGISEISEGEKKLRMFDNPDLGDDYMSV